MARRVLSQARKARSLTLAVRLAPALAFACGAVVAALASGACVQTGSSLGQSCLTNEDCFSGYCAAQVCVASPALLDAEPGDDSATSTDGQVTEASSPSDGSTWLDGSGDATIEAAADGPAATDGSTTPDASLADGDAGHAPDSSGSNDAAGEAGPEAAGPDAEAGVAGDAAQDAPADVRLDVGGGG